MTIVKLKGYLLPTLLVAAIGLAVGALYWEWMQGQALKAQLLERRKIPVTPVPDQKVLPEFALPEVDKGFPELTARPVFVPSRRGVGGADQAGGAMKKGQFVLVGVLVTPQQSSALLRDVQTNKTETVAAGAVVRGMTVGEVAADHVTLRQGPEQEALPLNVQSGGKAAPTVPGAAPPGTAPTPAPGAPPKPMQPPSSALRELPAQERLETKK
jgi:hypothetical protein